MVVTNLPTVIKLFTARGINGALCCQRDSPPIQMERTELLQPGMADTTSFLYKKDALWNNVGSRKGILAVPA